MSSFKDILFEVQDRVATLTLNRPEALNALTFDMLYEVQAAVSHEKTPNYLSQRMLHWIDEAAFFQVLMERNVRVFSGVTDLAMRAKWDAYAK